MVEQLPVKELVPGSSPGRGAKKKPSADEMVLRNDIKFFSKEVNNVFFGGGTSMNDSRTEVSTSFSGNNK